MTFQKGHIGYKAMLGKKFSEEHKRKIGLSHIGKKLSKGVKEKISDTLKRIGHKPPSPKGRKYSTKIKKEMSLRFMGKKRAPFSKEWLENMSLAQIGQNHWNWKGGISFESYGLEFNKKLKEDIRKRDNFRCRECYRHQDELRTKNNKSYKLLIHHIDYNKQNNNSNNLISLCRNCHLKTNYNREDWKKYFQNVITK